MNEVFGKKLGQYILLEQLGAGGMARVYNALDTRAESNVAIKVILPSKRTSAVFIQQFELEAKALASLAHTNIVKVLNYGVQDGQPYLVMQYIPGGTLKEAMTGKLPWQTAAAILAPIARALDYVHHQQIVHRDVKPSNILLDEGFHPMLSDFGILKVLEGREEKMESAIGAGLGTPEYMPPEQGRGAEVDFRADIYSLGLVFYEMITGQKAFTADSPMAVVIKQITDELPLPTMIDKNIPRMVERVILRAVQKDPKKRYLSMGHFADALELIALGDKAPLQKINRLSREREKRQRSFSILFLSILLFVVLLGSSLFAVRYYRQGQAGEVATLAGPLAPKATSTATRPPPSTATQPPTHLPTTQAATVPPSALSLLGTPFSPVQDTTLQEIARWGIGSVNVVRWSPDGQAIALGTSSGIFLLDGQTQASTLFIDTQFNVVALSFDQAGDRITAGSPTGLVKSWDVKSGAFVQEFSYTRPDSETITNDTTVTAISYSVDGIHLAVGYGNGAINYFSSDNDTADRALEDYPTIEDLAISPDGHFIFASNGTREVSVWDVQNGTKSASLSSPSPINRLSLSHDKQWMLTGGDKGVAYLWNLFESRNVSSFSNLGGAITAFDFSHDDQFVVIGLGNGGIRIFAMPAGREEYSKTHLPVKAFKAYDEKILSIDTAPDRLIFATGNQQEGLKLWDVQSGENISALNASRRAIEEIYFSRDGAWLASSHEGGLLRVWNVREGKEAYPALEGFLSKGAPFSPDSRFLVYLYSPADNRDSLIRVMDLKSGQTVAELPDSHNGQTVIRFSNFLQKPFVQFTDDSRLLIIANAYSTHLWDVATWEQLDTGGGVAAGCGQYVTPQNQLLVLVSNAGIMFPPYDDRKQEMCGLKPRGAILMYYFHEAHRMIFVLGNEKGDLWIWRRNTAEYGLIQSDTSYPTPNKIFLAGDQASGLYAYVNNGKITIKNINGATIGSIEGQDDYQYRVALLPEKNLMALGSRYGSIHLWALP